VAIDLCLLAAAAHQAAHQGGPRLTFDEACPHCLRTLLKSRVSCNDLAGLKDDVLEALAVDEASQVRRAAAAQWAGACAAAAQASTCYQDVAFMYSTPTPTEAAA